MASDQLLQRKHTQRRNSVVIITPGCKALRRLHILLLWRKENSAKKITKAGPVLNHKTRNTSEIISFNKEKVQEYNRFSVVVFVK